MSIAGHNNPRRPLTGARIETGCLTGAPSSAGGRPLTGARIETF